MPDGSAHKMGDNLCAPSSPGWRWPWFLQASFGCGGKHGASSWVTWNGADPACAQHPQFPLAAAGGGGERVGYSQGSWRSKAVMLNTWRALPTQRRGPFGKTSGCPCWGSWISAPLVLLPIAWARGYLHLWGRWYSSLKLTWNQTWEGKTKPDLLNPTAFLAKHSADTPKHKYGIGKSPGH